MTTQKPNLPGYKSDQVISVNASGGEANYESYWALLKADDPPADDVQHTAEEITAFAKAAKPKNVSQVGQAFLDFNNALNKINLPNKGEMTLTEFIMEMGRQLHEAWSGGATAAPEAQRQLTLLYQSAQQLMDTSAQAGYTIKAHGDDVLPKFTKWFDGSDHTLDSATSVYMDGEWKTNNYDKYPALQGANHTKQDELNLGHAEQVAMKAFRDDWARKKLAEHNTNVSSSYDLLPYSLDLSFPPGADVPKSPDPVKDTGDHGKPTTPPVTPHSHVPSAPSTPSTTHHVPVPSGVHPSITSPAGVIDHSGSHTTGGTDLSGVDNSSHLHNPGGTNLDTPPNLGDGGGTRLTNPNTGPGPTTGLGGGDNPFTPGLIRSPSLGGGGLGPKGSNPLGIKTPSATGPDGTIGARGSVNTAAATAEAEEATAATAANATRAGGGAGMVPPMMGGGQGQQQQDRERGTWLPEDHDFWASSDEVAPPVIGRKGE
ncbi:hypothetical protein [Actinoallomurus acaciae]|uniref:PPE family protein n=1 Tax=Actinoallomurus acaciae TaxID=502577 RepID=A0ABV5YAC7_9ACTN